MIVRTFNCGRDLCAAFAFTLLASCSQNPQTNADIATGAAVGAAGGAVVGAVAPGISAITGASVGAAIGGLAGAAWADNNNDGYVDGYVYNGQYYSGPPAGYDPTTHAVVTGALGGAAVGAVAGAVIPGVSVPAGAMIGAPLGGLAGAIWADRNNDGVVDGYVYNGQYYAGGASVSTPGSTVRTQQTSGPARGDFDEPHFSPNLIALNGIARIVVASNHKPLVDVRPWQTTNGALAPRALLAILEECVRSFDHVGPDCLATVRAGSGEFSAVPDDARREFVTIYKESCSPDASENACVQKLQNAAMFRALPRGGLHLSPMRMNEGERVLFTATIKDSGQIEGRPGLSTDVGFEPSVGHPGEATKITVVPYSPRMCFTLTSPDPTKAKIEPIPGERRTIEPPSRICMTEADGMEAVKYDPSWWVTPLSGDDAKLYLTIQHYLGNQRRDFPQEPWPIIIDVIPKPTWWERINAFLRHATETVGLGTNLAKGIGVLISVIMGWRIWDFVRRRKLAAATSS